MNVYPLSNAQKRIWFTQKKYENSSLFNIGGTVKISGNIDVNALKQAISNTILRNPGLKLRLIEKNNEVFQYISNEISEVDYVDFSDIEKEKAFVQWCDKQARTPFPMIDSPLYYFAVFKIADKQMGYFIKLHHIIADGWSIQLLTDQITKEYEKIILLQTDNDKGKIPIIEEPSYIDFVLNEESQLNQIDKAKEYWNEMYSKLPELSFSSCKLNGQRLSFVPDEVMQAKIEDYIRRHRISLNTFIIFVYILYTYKKYGKKDVIVGMPLLGRRGRIERQTFGNFTNTMPYRFNVDEKDTLVNMLKNISIDTRDCLRYQNYPYNLLHKDLQLTEKGGGNLYNICVNYYNTYINTTFGGYLVENKEFYNGQQEYALQIIIRHWNDIKLQLDFDFQTDLYSEQQIKDMYQQFLILMNQLFLNDDKRVEDLVLIDEEEKRNIVDTFNQTTNIYPKNKTWLDLLEDVAIRKPQRIAISQNKESVTYGELDIYTNLIARNLILAGVKKGDIVAIRPEYDIPSILIIIAVMKCGGIYLPIDINLPISRTNEILQTSEADFFIARENHSSFNGKFITFGELVLDDGNEDESINYSEPSNLAYILYTSGSTGTPKGVMVTHNNLMNYLCWAKDTYIKLDKEVFPLYSSFSFDFTLTSIFLPLISGHEIRIYNSIKEDNVFKKIIEENKATIIKITPSHIALIQDVNIKMSKIHTFIVGGENLKTYVCKQLFAKFHSKVNIYNEYGPTEATIGCMIYLYDNDLSESVPIGKPIANTSIYLLDQDMKPVPDETIGEIYIGGDSVSKGYYKSPDETCKRFLTSPFRENEIIYKTGDKAYRNETGNLIYFGRLDNEVKIRGNRINISEIEQKILASNMVKDVLVTTTQSKTDNLQLCAYVVPLKAFDINKLRAYLEEHLPSYMLPYYFTVLDSFPLTHNGKIDLKKLPSQSLVALTNQSKNENTKEYRILLQALKDLFHEEVSIEDNFYVLGGDSIKAIQLSSRISDRGYELAVRDILSHPYLYELVNYIKTKRNILYEQGTSSGVIQKTPVISWFFDQNFNVEGHYNQSVLLELRQSIPIETLNKVFIEIIKHHDILRLNYDKDLDGLYYNNEHLNKDLVVDVIHFEGKEINQLLELIDSDIRHNFDLQKDLLIKFYLLEAEDKAYLYITAHHLVIDGVSWRIILEDFSTLLNQIKKDESLSLPEKTIDYSQYAERYKQWAEEIKIDTQYWDSILSVDNLLCNNRGQSTYADTVEAQIQLNESMTEQFLGQANKPYHTQPNELLLIALVNAIYQVFSINEIVLMLEGHGRDVLEGVNANRTIGWFTNLYPILLNIQEPELQGNIKALKEQIKKGVKKGYEYSVLKYQSYEKMPKKMIYFNYLGDFSNISNDCYKLEHLLFDCNIAEDNLIPFLIEVNAFVIDKKLNISVKIDKNELKSYIDHFIQRFETVFIGILDHCISLKERIFTPTDFESANLTQEELDGLF